MTDTSRTDTPRFLPYGRQDIDEDDIRAVVEVLRSDWLTQGPRVEAFETALAERLKVPHVVACANGTAALHLAALALDLGPGDAVVVPSITFLATANAVRLVGAEVALADVAPETALLTPEAAAAAALAAHRAGLRVRAVFPVHFAGQTVDVQAIREAVEITLGHEVAVVEDACHALGSTDADSDGADPDGADPDGADPDGGPWRPVGSCPDSRMACFSFHPVKTVAAGEGGAIATRDPALATRLRRLRNHGMVREPEEFTDPIGATAADGGTNPWWYEMPAPGLNYRLTDLQSALATSQLRRLDVFVERRRRLVALYDRLLAPLAPVVRSLERLPGRRPGWHLQVALIDFAAIGHDRAAVMAELRAVGIGTQVHYIPLSRQPHYRHHHGTAHHPGAEAYYARALSLPLFAAMTDDDVARVSEGLARVMGLSQNP